MTTDLFDLSAFAAANPDRPILLILPAEEPADASPETSDELVPTLLYGETRREEAGDLSVRIRFQRDLDLRAICFTGSTRGDVVRVQSVFVGDAPVFTEGEGVPIGHFEAGPLARVLKGWKARAGLDLSIHANASGPARLCVSVLADKRRCR